MTWYATVGDAFAKANTLSATEIGSAQTEVYYRLEDLQTGCFDVSNVTLVLAPVPDVALDDEYIFCIDMEGNITDDAFIDTGLSESRYDFEWLADNGNGDRILDGETGSNLIVSEEGVYTVLVIDEITGCENIAITEVIASRAPQRFIARNTGSAVFNDHTITAEVILGGSEEGYEVRLNDGQWREMLRTNRSYMFTFRNVETSDGIQQVYFRSIDSCWEAVDAVRTVGMPQYFTPNEDGFNDFWNAEGITGLEDDTEIYIFDRYGKLVKQIDAGGVGWDGTYNGQLLPSTDYWFKVEIDSEVMGRMTLTGHFALKR